MIIDPNYAAAWGELLRHNCLKQTEKFMCGNEIYEKATTQPPERRLARLMERDLSLPYRTVNSVALRLFIKARWSTLTALAHAIHNDD